MVSFLFRLYFSGCCRKPLFLRCEMKFYNLLAAGFVLFLLSGQAFGQNFNKEISANFAKIVEKASEGKKADIGVAVAAPGIHWQNADRKYPLLSVFKLHVAAAVLDKADKSHIPLEKAIQVAKTDMNRDLYSPMLQKYGPDRHDFSLRELLYYMVAESDNNACDILIKWLGGIKQVENYAHQIGLLQTEIVVDETGMNRDINLQYANRAPLEEIILLLRLIDEKKLFSAEIHRELAYIMGKTATGADKIKKYLPPEVSVKHKTGSSSRLKNGIKIADNDVAIIQSGAVKYYLAVMVSDSSESDKANAEIIAQISAAIYRILQAEES